MTTVLVLPRETAGRAVAVAAIRRTPTIAKEANSESCRLSSFGSHPSLRDLEPVERRDLAVQSCVIRIEIVWLEPPIPVGLAVQSTNGVAVASRAAENS